MEKKIRLIEVAMRDGLQSLSSCLSLEEKVEFLNKLWDCGAREIEIGAFVSPKVIPQMAQSGQLALAANKKYPKGLFSALIPNLKGCELAQESQINRFAFVLSVSETHNRKNIGREISNSKKEYENCIKSLANTNFTRMYLSCAFDCPYEGETSDESLFNEIEWALNLGVNEISLGDTMGSATFPKTKVLAEKILKKWPAKEDKFVWHFHNSFGQALANISCCLELGFYQFDSSLGGLGGCPAAPGATGNVPTEDIIFSQKGKNSLLSPMDFQKCLETKDWLNQKVCFL